MTPLFVERSGAMTPNDSIRFFDSLPDGALVPARTAAAILSLSRVSIWRLTKAGKLTSKKIGERATRFNVGELRRFIASRG
jgi:predicted DNA-binding transcriptional regulator AlpA